MPSATFSNRWAPLTIGPLPAGLEPWPTPACARPSIHTYAAKTTTNTTVTRARIGSSFIASNSLPSTMNAVDWPSRPPSSRHVQQPFDQDHIGSALADGRQNEPSIRRPRDAAGDERRPVAEVGELLPLAG